MSIKLLLLKSGDQVIAEAKELVRKEGDHHLMDKVYGYLLTQPHKVSVNRPMVLTEDVNDQSNVEITLAPWILLTEDKVMTIPKEWVITIVNPIDSIVKMYQEKIDGQSN
tara:strand:- start:599 stop:928 length:330 start_codon:yes stop_codon:yes gene_type:complete